MNQKAVGCQLNDLERRQQMAPKAEAPGDIFRVGRILLDAVQLNAAARSSDQINHELSFSLLMCSFRRENGSPINLGEGLCHAGERCNRRKFEKV
jgi:hypothetical protein